MKLKRFTGFVDSHGKPIREGDILTPERSKKVRQGEHWEVKYRNVPYIRPRPYGCRWYGLWDERFIAFDTLDLRILAYPARLSPLTKRLHRKGVVE